MWGGEGQIPLRAYNNRARTLEKHLNPALLAVQLEIRKVLQTTSAKKLCSANSEN